MPARSVTALTLFAGFLQSLRGGWRIPGGMLRRRAVRVTARDGVQLGGNDDLQPGRLSLTVCNDIMVDTLMDLEAAR